jgi:hypothetical protein
LPGISTGVRDQCFTREVWFLFRKVLVGRTADVEPEKYSRLKTQARGTGRGGML